MTREGSGGFLVEALKHVWKKVESEGKNLNWPENEIYSEKQEIAIKNFRGIDKDYFLSKVAKAYMAIIGDGRGGVYCENSLENPENWQAKTRDNILFEHFDIIITNPPYGKKLKIEDTEILTSFDLGHKWKYIKNKNHYEKEDKLKKNQSPQILFIERCLKLLKPGGKLGIIAPESMFCNPSHRYIQKFIRNNARISAIISLPEELFQPHTHAKTCAVIIEKNEKPIKEHNNNIFMGIAKWCGHDSRGLMIPYDDIPKIIEKYKQYKSTGVLKYSHLGFIIEESNIVNNIFLPKYYDPEIDNKLDDLASTHDLYKFGDLVNSGLLSVATGDEVGKLSYGTGNIPFIRTSEIANWEIKIDPKHGLSNQIYEIYKEKQNIQENDILMVRDGTYLVGTCGLITKKNLKIVYQSHMYKIRSNDLQSFHPFLLLAILSSPIVQMQIKAKRFTQDIIDTLGNRINELILPIPKSSNKIAEIIEQVSQVIDHKSKARELTERTVPLTNWC